MPTYLHKYPEAGRRCYLFWSTVVDAPVTYGMTLRELKAHYRDKYGTEGMRELPDRIKRADAKGTSYTEDPDPEGDIACNRAGHGETHLTRKQIVEWYCVKRKAPPKGIGVSWAVIQAREDATERKRARKRTGSAPTRKD